jgi:hypothetical protein
MARSPCMNVQELAAVTTRKEDNYGRKHRNRRRSECPCHNKEKCDRKTYRHRGIQSTTSRQYQWHL